MMGLASVGLLAALVGPALAGNLLTNPQVVNTSDPWHTWARKGQPQFAYDTATGHGDNTSLRVASLEKGTDGSWLQSITCEGGTVYTGSFWFRTDPPGGTTSLLVEFGSPQGYAGQVRREVKADGAEWTRYEETFPAPPQATTLQFEVWVNLDDAGQSTAWFDDFSLATSTRPVVEFLLEAPLYHVLRPGKGGVRGHLTQTNPRAARAKYTAQLRRGDETLAKASGLLTREATFEIPAERAAEDGTYTLSVKVESETVVVFASEETLVRRAEPPEVDIGAHRELLVEGKPFFPIGVYWAGLADLKDLPANGFNCVHGWQYANDDGRAFLAEAKRVGLRVVLEMSDTLRGQTALDAIAERVKAFRQDPALLCYYPVDEPWPPNTDPVGMRQAYNLIKSLDPDHPIMHVQCSLNYLTTYLGATDIVSVDPYGSPDYVQQCMAQANGVSGGRKPVWAVIGTFPWAAFGGLPTPEYVRCATYVALIGGAKGVLYFTYHFENHNLKDTVLWEPLGQLNREVTTLAPWLLACEPAPVKTSDERVVAATFRQGESAVLLVANRSEKEAVDVKVMLPEVRGQAKGVFDRATAPCDGDLDFHLAPYATVAVALPPKGAW